MSWYKEWFGKDYIDVYTHRNESEAEEFINTLSKRVSLKPGQRLLDLCCGAGRYSLTLAKYGCSVVGIDLSEHLLKIARNSAEKSGASIDFQVRDMRDIPFKSYFNGVVNMFTSFGYFSSDAENEQVIASVSSSLLPGGWFVMDFLNTNYIVDNFRPYDKIEKGNITVEQHRKINTVSNRIEKRIVLKKNGSTKEYFESVRLYTRQELESFYISNNLKPVYTFGNYDGSKFLTDSPRMILIGIK